MNQTIFTSEGNFRGIDKWIQRNAVHKILLVCGGSIRHMISLNRKFEELTEAGIPVVRFHNFQPNPLYESVVRGVEVFRVDGCDAIAAVGGGSAMDVAKCIRLFCNMHGDGSDGGFLNQTTPDSHVPFLAVPTTAGSGSEATRYAVIYFGGQKQSVTSECCIPDVVLFDERCLSMLSLYQRKSTMMDAFCHALESFWSVHSSDESKSYSKDALNQILKYKEGYLDNTQEGNRHMQMAAYTAGKAINLAQTTAGHAMCYQITSLFGCAHGHAAALCNRELFSWMVQHTDACVDQRGEAYLKSVLDEIAIAMGCDTPEEAASKFASVVDSLELEIPAATEAQFEKLKMSVNPVRLQNNPANLSVETIDRMYRRILRTADLTNTKSG